MNQKQQEIREDILLTSCRMSRSQTGQSEQVILVVIHELTSGEHTSLRLAPLVFRPCLSSSFLYSRSSDNHCNATRYKDDGSAYFCTALEVGSDEDGKGQGVGSVTKTPNRM